MKVIQSPRISAFGGLNFVIKETLRLKVKSLFESELPAIAKQARYSWFDIIMAYWSIFFCGGDCAEDLDVNLKDSLQGNPFINIPSPDRVLGRIKSLADAGQFFKAKRGSKEHHFSIAMQLNKLNLKMLSLLPGFKKDNVVLDYDNTLIFTEKSDAERTYKKENGYSPGVGTIGNHIVYVENRNGSSTAHVLQHETIDRMSGLLQEEGITVEAIRADSASYTYEIIKSMEKAARRVYIKARMNESLERAISSIEEWREIKIGDKIIFRGSTSFVPFERSARGNKEKTESLKRYRLVVTKEARKDGQMNIFTGEAFNYSPILTNDFDKSDDEVVFFYNDRGAQEREFDVLKNDFGWDKMPFSKLEQNTVFLLVMAMCRNLYAHIIETFAKKVKVLSPNFRIKKFIFRFICIPGKWVISGRTNRLRLFGPVLFET